jgi:hypothetical protein
MKITCLLSLFFAATLMPLEAAAQPVRPHILVTDSEKAAVLQKINEQEWAKTITEKLTREVSPFVERHVTEPEWILSRYLMNRVPGKRYTRVISDNGGLRALGFEGDAPVPTVRVGSHIRVPVTPAGFSYRRPSIGELVPYDTSRLMNLYNNETKQKEWIDPQSFVGDINGDINELALDAAIIYWLHGDERYAKFAADILDQWVRGAFHQEPVKGPCRTGFLEMQTLGDAQSRPLILAYDFVYNWMKHKGYDLQYYETVFEKIASTLAFRGLWNNNWYAAESSTMVFASLSLDNQAKKDYYLQFFLTKDTINGSCGQLALPSTVEKWLTPDGHWKEPGGYHNYPVSNLLISALALEKNGYDIFRKFPALFKASYAMLKYSFPDLTVSAFGDTGRASQGGESLEIGIFGAVKYNDPVLPEMLASMKKLVDGGRYSRENSGIIGLLCYVPGLPEVNSSYSWPRSGSLEFARFFLQRNGMDAETGLMYGVQGASYNHNHCNGMAMELYGAGLVMGIDAGTGPTYEHPLHQTYFSQWAAHNTVAAAGASSSVPFSGSAGRKNIGQIELAAMEPMPDRDAVSPVYSFTDTRYTDISTNTAQKRTMALIRTSPSTGYYVDIFRSGNKLRNDYIYHNIGDELTFVNDDRERIVTDSTSYPTLGKDYPGFRYFSDVRKLSGWKKNLIALFHLKDENERPVYMQVLVPASGNRTYFQAKSLKAKTAGRRYSAIEPPVFSMVDFRESESEPFVAVFEPYRNVDGYSVERISLEKREDGLNFTSLNVYNRNGSRQHILQSPNPDLTFASGTAVFRGHMAVVDFSGKVVRSLYLGEGNEITCEGYSIVVPSGKGSASLTANERSWTISSNQTIKVTLPAKGKKFFLVDGERKLTLPVTRKGNTVTFALPKIMNATITIEK